MHKNAWYLKGFLIRGFTGEDPWAAPARLTSPITFQYSAMDVGDRTDRD